MFLHLNVPDLTKVILSNNQLTTITNKFPSTIRYLDLSNNQIKSLDYYSFKSLYSLNVLNLSYNSLLEIQQDTFTRIPYLEILDLSYNLLSTFVFSFPLPSNLKYLYLDSNPNLIEINFGHTLVQQRLIGLSLRHNKNMKLSSFPPHLTQLDLTDCNIVQSSILPLFVSLTKLTHLSLADNQLERLPSIDKNVRLEYLNVSNNRLTSIEDHWLNDQLHFLDLTFNQIQSLEFLKSKLNTGIIGIYPVENIGGGGLTKGGAIT